MAGPGAYCFGDEERREVMDVLESGHFSRYGNLSDPNFKHKVYSFEEEFAQYCGTKHALATNSGTSSLFICLLALGIGEGDEVLVPGYTYVASISSIIYARATPVLVEIDESLTIDPLDIEKKITNKTKAIMAVHMLGNPCKMTEIRKIASEHDLAVIEDGCQAAGATYKGRKVGSLGDIAAFSLNRYKNMAAGDGGVITVSNKSLYERAFAIHDQGHRPNRTSKDAAGSLIGLNLKANELTGAVALAQLRKLDVMLHALRAKKKLLKDKIQLSSDMRHRELNDTEGECATLLTFLFDNSEKAKLVAERLGIKTLSGSGWHVYNNIEQIYNHSIPSLVWSEKAKFSSPGSLPQTDSILSRSINLSVGVVDEGLGSGFGINIHSSKEEIENVAQKFNEACQFDAKTIDKNVTRVSRFSDANSISQ